MFPRHIFLQLCTGGDLFSYIISHVKTSYRLCEGEAKYIMYQILIGVKHLHDKKISHRGDDHFDPCVATPRADRPDADLKVSILAIGPLHRIFAHTKETSPKIYCCATQVLVSYQLICFVLTDTTRSIPTHTGMDFCSLPRITRVLCIPQIADFGLARPKAYQKTLSRCPRIHRPR